MVFNGCMNCTRGQYHKKVKKKREKTRDGEKNTRRPTSLNAQTLNIFINQIHLLSEYMTLSVLVVL